jgi:hypothetical protein
MSVPEQWVVRSSVGDDLVRTMVTTGANIKMTRDQD